MRVRILSVAAAAAALLGSLPAYAQDLGQVSTAANTIPAGAVDNTIPVWVWVWILAAGVFVTVGCAAAGGYIIGDRKK